MPDCWLRESRDAAAVGCSDADPGPESATSSLDTDPSPRRAGSPKSVVVLGAGLAGLCAAYELAARGFEVVAILEA